MLQVTGSIGGVKYNKSLVTPEELLKITNNEDIHTALSRKTLYLTYPQYRMEADPLNEGIRAPAGFSTTLKYSLSTPEGIVSIIYYTGSEHDGVRETFSPKKIDVFTGAHVKAFNVQEDKEFLLFLLLSPKNQDSPFCKVKMNASYCILDQEKKAIEENRAILREVEAITMIKDLQKNDPKLFKRKALGVEVHGFRVPNSELVMDSDEMLLGELMKLMRIDAKEFLLKFKEDSSMIRGLITEALAKNVFEITYQNSFVVVSIAKSEITRFGSSTDPVTGIASFMLENNFKDWQTRIISLLDNTSVDEKINKALAGKKDKVTETV